METDLCVRSPEQFAGSAKTRIRVVNSCVFDLHAAVSKKLEQSGMSQSVFKADRRSPDSAIKIIVDLGGNRNRHSSEWQDFLAVLGAVTIKALPFQLHTQFEAAARV